LSIIKVGITADFKRIKSHKTLSASLILFIPRQAGLNKIKIYGKGAVYKENLYYA